MPTMHTGNTPFHSMSPSIGSARWRFDRLPTVSRGYILDLAFKGYLPNRWYAVVLVNHAGAYTLRVHGAGSASDCSLEETSLQEVMATDPIISEALNVHDEATALDRLERGVALVMHNLLDPAPEVAFIWQRVATTNGDGILSPP